MAEILTKVCKHCGAKYQTDSSDLRGYCSSLCLLQDSIKQLGVRCFSLESALRTEQSRSAALRHELALSYRQADALQQRVMPNGDWLDPKPGEF